MTDITVQAQPARAVTRNPTEELGSSATVKVQAAKSATPVTEQASPKRAETAATEQASAPKAAAVNASTIMTYRDSDSGRLVVKLLDKDNNAVITEFPSPSMLSNYPPRVSAPAVSGSVDKEV